VSAGLLAPHTAVAQDYTEWYGESERHYLELRQKAGGGTKDRGQPDYNGRPSR
jgi:hypothetical protein